MTTCRKVLMLSLLALGGLFVSAGQSEACFRRGGAVCYDYNPCYYQPNCYQPCYPCGEVVAISATIIVYLPADAQLFANGKLMEGSGPVRILTTTPIPLGKTKTVTLKVRPPKDDDDEGPAPPPSTRKEFKAKEPPKEAPKKAPPQTQEVVLHPNETKYVDFNAPQE